MSNAIRADFDQVIDHLRQAIQPLALAPKVAFWLKIFVRNLTSRCLTIPPWMVLRFARVISPQPTHRY
mgnify:CR=1 FL=1